MDELSADDLCERVKNLVTAKWCSDISEKSTLELDKNYIMEIREEHFYDNSYESCLLFHDRGNILNLDWRNGFGEVHLYL